MRERIVKQLTEDSQNPSRWNTERRRSGLKRGRRRGRYCNTRDVPDNVTYVYMYVYIRACSRASIRLYIRQSRGRLSLIHIHQTLINHRPAHPRQTTPSPRSWGEKKCERCHADTSIYYELHPDVEVVTVVRFLHGCTEKY